MPDDDDQRLREQLAELEAANEGLQREIEQFRRAEEVLRFGEERYRSLVEAITAIVWNTPAQRRVRGRAVPLERFHWPDVRAAQGMGLAERGPPRRPPEHRPRVVGCRREPVVVSSSSIACGGTMVCTGTC